MPKKIENDFDQKSFLNAIQKMQGGVFIPRWAASKPPSLTPNEYCVLMYLFSEAAGNDGKCTKTQEEIGRHNGFCLTVVKSCLKKLQELNFISIERIRNSSKTINIYLVNGVCSTRSSLSEIEQKKFDKIKVLEKPTIFTEKILKDYKILNKAICNKFGILDINEFMKYGPYSSIFSEFSTVASTPVVASATVALSTVESATVENVENDGFLEDLFCSTVASATEQMFKGRKCDFSTVASAATKEYKIKEEKKAEPPRKFREEIEKSFFPETRFQNFLVSVKKDLDVVKIIWENENGKIFDEEDLYIKIYGEDEKTRQVRFSFSKGTIRFRDLFSLVFNAAEGEVLRVVRVMAYSDYLQEHDREEPWAAEEWWVQGFEKYRLKN